MLLPLHTDRLLLRAATADDAPAVFAYRRLPSVAHYMTSAEPDFDRWRTYWEQGLAQTVVAERDGVIVGDLKFAVEDAWGQAEVAERARGAQAEIGWAFDPAVAGQGLATEAARALLAAGFADGLHRVVAYCFTENEPSRRMMRRLGLRHEGTYRQDSLHRDGSWRDSDAWAVLREEWPPAPSAT